MGSLRQRRGRDSQIWYLRYTDLDGKQREESSRTSSYDEALRLLKQREGDLARHIPVSPETHQLTVGACLKDLYRDYELREIRTLDHARWRIDRYVKPFFGRMRRPHYKPPTSAASSTKGRRPGRPTPRSTVSVRC